jgi:putative tryptophan/tyrosine transport system substrate-binding protein
MKKIWQLLLIIALAILPEAIATAQQPAKIKIGFLAFGSPPPGRSPSLEAFRQGLRDLGYVEGRDFALIRRYAKGELDRLPGLATELVKLKMDVIVTSGTSAAWAAKEASTTIPIIMAGASDPVASGLVSSLAHPGGNVTGFSELPGREIEGKRLELLKEVVPMASQVAVVLDSTSRRDPTPLENAAKALGLTLLLSDEEVESTGEFRKAFDKMVRERADALYAPETPVNVRYRNLIISLAAKNRIPTMYGSREFVEAGGLMSYGSSFAELFSGAATYVDKVLKGTKPADLPVQQPIRFELVINLKTAKQIGLKIPQSVLFRADEVIR